MLLVSAGDLGTVEKRVKNGKTQKRRISPISWVMRGNGKRAKIRGGRNNE
jgi:hypothetical protein